MPARETAPPRTLPGHLTSRLSHFPEGEIFRVVLLLILPFAVHAINHVLKLIAGELAIARKTLNIKIDRLATTIGHTLRQQTLDNLNHLRHVLRGTRKNMRGENIQGLLISVESTGIELRDLRGGPAFFACLRNHLILALVEHLLAHMTNIGNILDMPDLDPAIFIDPPQPVDHSKGTQVAYMDITIDRRPAGIHADAARFSWNNLLDTPVESIIDAHAKTSALEATIW